MKFSPLMYPKRNETIAGLKEKNKNKKHEENEN
jgi:hypothetical protein